MELLHIAITIISTLVIIVYGVVVIAVYSVIRLTARTLHYIVDSPFIMLVLASIASYYFWRLP